MKLATYRRTGTVHHGQVDGDRVRELGDGDLMAFLTSPASATALGMYDLAEVELLAPLLRPGKLLAVAANYQDHVTESGAAPLDRSRLSPRLFLKPTTSIVGPDAIVELPDVSRQVDWEAELAVVIGRGGKRIAIENALDHVAGYCCANDVSARSVDYGYERDVEDKAVWFFDWLAGKWLDGFAPIGPYLVTADEVPDPQDRTIEFRLNGLVKQDGSTKDMIFSVAELIAHASRLTTLEPGDVILTGTPSGVGAATGEFLAAGDEMTVTISGLGTLRNSVK